ncbi:MAG: amidohydrolase family protein, partial [Spirochaetales bacterium]|nr:amidohydrolase family protein [Spirochaetales bacterium]
MSVLFRNATVIDGSGERPFEADVLVRGTTIVKICPEGSVTQQDAEVIDATGKILCPGFMDMHAHSDLELIRNPSMPYKIQQGITFD